MKTYTFTQNNQSHWIVDIYNQYLEYKLDGFLVEIGVGHTISGVDKYLPTNLENFQRVGSNTADLLDLGWSGIYIEPVKEYCDEARIAHRDNLDRLNIINIGAGNEKGQLEMFLGDSFIPNAYGKNGYDWIGRTVEVDITSNILEKYNCPYKIDIMSIDVEGFEHSVISGIDFDKYMPKILIVEVDKVPVDYINNILPNPYTMVYADGTNAAWVSKNN